MTAWDRVTLVYDFHREGDDSPMEETLARLVASLLKTTDGRLKSVTIESL